MADTTFVDGVITAANRIVSAWLNTVNNLVYRGTNPLYVTTTGSANAYTLTLPATSLLTALSAGSEFTAKANFANTSATTLTVVGGSSLGPYAIQLGAAALSGGEIPNGSSFKVVFDGTVFQLMSVNGNVLRTGPITTSGLTMTTARLLGRTTAGTGAIEEITAGSGLTLSGGSLTNSILVPRSYLAGCTLSTAGSSATMSIAAGQAVDSTNVLMMPLTAIAKTTSAWAVGTGNGGLDTGSIANATWYHFYVIERVDTAVVDVVFSTSANSPTLPANYTLYRRIGAGLTDGSAQWTAFTQVGDSFIWTTPVLDVNATNPGTSAVTRTLTVPTGVVVEASISATGLNATSGSQYYVYVSPLAVTDQAAAAAAAPLNSFTVGTVAGTGYQAGAQMRVLTNTAAQIRSRQTVSAGSDYFGIATLGWADTRGKLV